MTAVAEIRSEEMEAVRSMVRSESFYQGREFRLLVRSTADLLPQREPLSEWKRMQAETNAIDGLTRIEDEDAGWKHRRPHVIATGSRQFIQKQQRQLAEKLARQLAGSFETDWTGKTPVTTVIAGETVIEITEETL
jgi:hypothetical protein